MQKLPLRGQESDLQACVQNSCISRLDMKLQPFICFCIHHSVRLVSTSNIQDEREKVKSEIRFKALKYCAESCIINRDKQIKG